MMIKLKGFVYRDSLSNRTVGDAEVANKVLLVYFWNPKNQDSIQGFKPLLDMQAEIDKQWAEVQKAAAAKKEPIPEMPLVIVAYNVGGQPVAARGIALQLDRRWIFHNAPPADQDQLMKIAKAEEKDLPIANVQDKNGAFMWAGAPKDAPQQIATMLGIHLPTAAEMPDNPVGAVNSLREALKLVEEKGEYSKSLELVAKVPDKMLSDPAVMPHAAALVVRFRTDREHAKQIEKALLANPEAATKLKRMSGAVLAAMQAGAQRGEPAQAGGGVSVSVTATTKGAVDRDAIAAKKLEDADRFHQNNEPQNAYPLYKEIADHYANSPAAVFAAQHVTEYEKDPELMKKARGGDTQRKARSMLMAARGLRDSGRGDEARQTYSDLLDKYPDTPAAAEAAEDLRSLK